MALSSSQNFSARIHLMHREILSPTVSTELFLHKVIVVILAVVVPIVDILSSSSTQHSYQHSQRTLNPKLGNCNIFGWSHLSFFIPHQLYKLPKNCNTY